jgi:hypothetical protein
VQACALTLFYDGNILECKSQYNYFHKNAKWAWKNLTFKSEFRFLAFVLIKEIFSTIIYF